MRMLLAAFVLLFFPIIHSHASMPPDRYDRPFTGKLEKHRVPYGKAWDKCDEISRRLGVGAYDKGLKKIGKRALYGCSWGGKLWGKSWCIVVYSFDPTGSDRKMASNVLRHEVAHCNGWPNDHPNGK